MKDTIIYFLVIGGCVAVILITTWIVDTHRFEPYAVLVDEHTYEFHRQYAACKVRAAEIQRTFQIVGQRQTRVSCIRRGGV